ncbi:MAG: polysaccharide deacetylase family protein [Halioglobus sp.]
MMTARMREISLYRVRPISALMLLATGMITLLVGCSNIPSTGDLSMANMHVVAKDKHFALVKLHSGLSYEDIAEVFLGSRGQTWQIEEVNAPSRGKNGQIVAVPLKPLNPTSVYTDGYRTLPILCYHQFTAAAKASHQLELAASVFEQQLLHLIENEYEFLSFAQVEGILNRGQPIPEKAVVITVDDGYRSVYTVAWPILKRYQIPATLFIYTDFIGAPAALTWSQINEMKASGFIEIESHGKSHSSLSILPEDTNEEAYKARLNEEMLGTKRVFKKRLGEAPRFLSYPYGNSSVLAAQAAQTAAIELAATVTRGDNTTFADPYLLHRTMVYDSHSLADFKKMLRGYRKRNLR